jgi:amino acid adenylation domain-containing protein
MDTIWEAVATRAEQNPAATAARGERDLSYGELLRSATALGRRIQAGASAGQIVAMEATTPLGAATAILAAARSRCPVLPISKDCPGMRRTAMFTDAEPALIVRETEPDRFAVEQLTTRSSRPETANVAYVIYTSGSTGRPKGVVVRHEAFLARLDALAHVPGFAAGESFLAMSDFSFDPSLVELFLPLITGGSFVAAPPEARVDPAIFAGVVHQYRPDVMQATPSFLRLALAWGWAGAAGARLWSGGEILTPSLTRSLLPRCAQLWNVYGPTEATIWAAAAHITAADSIHLGEPVPGLTLRLEGDDGELITSGQPLRQGQILIYGDSLAQGYLNLPELTAQQFRGQDGTGRSYRSGDRGQYATDGTLQFLGRLDNQVKLRGHRIELAEVETVIEEHPAVREAVAVVVGADHPESAHLAVWLVADAESGLTSRQIRAWLSDRLPSGMRPGRISIVPTLPRTVTGKVDRISIASRISA